MDSLDRQVGFLKDTLMFVDVATSAHRHCRRMLPTTKIRRYQKQT